MFYYLKGEITIREDDFVVIDVSGVGYRVNVCKDTPLKKGEKATVYCHTQTTDNDTRLYGFCSKDNLELFEKLIKISGIGPKTALPVASCLTSEEVRVGIEKEDQVVIKKIFSIGKKKGQQVIFELSRKFIKEVEEDEAFATLKELGFAPAEIHRALEQTNSEMSSEERVSTALKNLGK